MTTESTTVKTCDACKRAQASDDDEFVRFSHTYRARQRERAKLHDVCPECWAKMLHGLREPPEAALLLDNYEHEIADLKKQLRDVGSALESEKQAKAFLLTTNEGVLKQLRESIAASDTLVGALKTRAQQEGQHAKELRVMVADLISWLGKKRRRKHANTLRVMVQKAYLANGVAFVDEYIERGGPS